MIILACQIIIIDLSLIPLDILLALSNSASVTPLSDAAGAVGAVATAFPLFWAGGCLAIDLP